MGLLMVTCAPMLGYFSYTRLKKYREDRTNLINYYYFAAAGAVSLAVFFYGFPSLLFPRSNALIAAGTAIATVLNAVGFSYFLLVPLHRYIQKKTYIILKHFVFLLAAGIAGMVLLFPPHSTLDSSGVIHWGFNSYTQWTMLTLITAAFVPNILLIWRNLKILKRFSAFNALALMLTFLTTGIGGGYLYIGDDRMFLPLATVLLFFGISIIFFSSVLTTMGLHRSPKEDFLAVHGEKKEEMPV